MEFERTIFRIYERILAVANPQKLLGLSLCFAGATFSCLIMLTILHVMFTDDCGVLSQGISDQLLGGSTKYTSSIFNLTLPIDEDDDSEYIGDVVMSQEDVYVIELGSVTYRFSALPQAATIPDEVFDRHDFAVHNLTFAKDDFISGYFAWLLKQDDWDTVILNQVSSLFSKYPGYLKNLKTDETWYWRAGEVNQFKSVGLWGLLLRLMRALGSYLLISNITALMCRVSITSSAAVLISLQTCCGTCERNEATQLMLFYSFPWIGQSLYALRSSGRRSAGLLLAYFTMFVAFYFMYACCYFVWTLMVFNHILPQGLDDNFFTLLNMLEFFSLIFLRSKRSIAYFPRFIGGAVVMFILYRLNHFYGFLGWAFMALLFWGISLMLFVVGCFEHSAFYSLSRPPTYDSPRLTYQPLLRSTSISPELWTIFYPVASAAHFTSREMQQAHPVT